MQYVKSPMFVAGVILLGAALIEMRPSLLADFSAPPSWDVSMPMRISLVGVGGLIAGAALIAASVIRLRSSSRQH